MFINLINFHHEDYQVDFDKFKIYLDYIVEIQDFAIDNNLDFTLMGHIALILMSNKIYRNPEDIDIAIPARDIEKWLDFFRKEWDWFGNVSNINSTALFLKDELQKFASTNIDTCSTKEEGADLYQIKNKNFSLSKKGKSTNQINKDIIAQPEFIYHDPLKEKLKGGNYTEIDNETFKIWFDTNGVGQSFKSFIIFYDANLQKKEIIECSFSHDFVKDNTTYACWSSPVIDLNKFNNCYYRIFIHKHKLSIKFQNKRTKIFLECYLDKSLFDSSVPIRYTHGLDPHEGFRTFFNKKPIKLSYPLNIFNSKYGRKKDLDDYEIYKDLIQKYPLTNL